MCDQGGMYWCAPSHLVQEVVNDMATDNYAVASDGDELTWVDSQQLGVKKRLIVYQRSRLDHGLELVAKSCTEEGSDIFDGTSDILQAWHVHALHISRESIRVAQNNFTQDSYIEVGITQKNVTNDSWHERSEILSSSKEGTSRKVHGANISRKIRNSE